MGFERPSLTNKDSRNTTCVTVKPLNFEYVMSLHALDKSVLWTNVLIYGPTLYT